MPGAHVGRTQPIASGTTEPDPERCTPMITHVPNSTSGAIRFGTQADQETGNRKQEEQPLVLQSKTSHVIQHVEEHER